MLEEILDAFEILQDLQKMKKEDKNRIRRCWMKFVLDQTFRPTFSGSSNQIFILDALEYSFIQHLVFHYCFEYKTYAVCVSNVFIDVRISIICGVSQNFKRREGHNQDKREEAKMASKKEKDSNGKKDWTDDEISLLMDMLDTNPCLWDVYHTDYTNRCIKEIAYTEIAASLDTNISSIKTKINCLRVREMYCQNVQKLLQQIQIQKRPCQMNLQLQKCWPFLLTSRKLSHLNKRHRRIAEKRITDILFEIEM